MILSAARSHHADDYPPPLPLQQALDWVRAGRPIYLYLPP
jgi:hypothetical protein